MQLKIHFSERTRQCVIMLLTPQTIARDKYVCPTYDTKHLPWSNSVNTYNDPLRKTLLFYSIHKE